MAATLGGAAPLPGVRTFDTVEELRQALLEFKARYNRAWLCQRHGHQTPVQVRERLLERAREAVSRPGGEREGLSSSRIDPERCPGNRGRYTYFTLGSEGIGLGSFRGASYSHHLGFPVHPCRLL